MRPHPIVWAILFSLAMWLPIILGARWLVLNALPLP